MTNDFLKAGFDRGMEEDKDHLVLNRRRFAFLLNEWLRGRIKVTSEKRQEKKRNRQNQTSNSTNNSARLNKK